MTDDELELLAEGPDLVIATPPEALESMDEVVRQMHTRSGLLDAIASSDVTLKEAADETLEFVRKHAPEARKVPLCGNSIGTDRRFLAAYMPELEEYLHYRSIDVSTIKELAQALVPRGLRRCPQEGWRPPRPRRHQGERRRAEILAQHGVPRKIFHFARLTWHHGLLTGNSTDRCITEVEMTRLMDAPFLDDAQGRRRQTSRTTRHAVRSHLHVALLDEESLDDAVLPVVLHDVGRKASPKPKQATRSRASWWFQGLEDLVLETQAPVVG